MKTKQLFKLFFIVISLFACKKKETSSPTTLSLFEMSKNSEGFTWYKKTSEYLKKSTGTGHSQPYMRTRYNSIASEMLDSLGKINSSAKFPEGSLIVKELMDEDYTIERYAILYKDTKNKDADTKGWVWGYINKDGTEAFPTANKGTSCIGCHSQTENIDYMLMNKYFK
jgi:hypothetical protein